MKSQLTDGAIQRQILFAKLDHEMGNRPDFGDFFDIDPDSEVQLRFARTGPWMKQVGIREGVEFQSALSAAL